MNESHLRNVIEAALLAAGKPLQLAELIELFDEGARPQAQDVQAALATLAAEYSSRGIEIKETAAGFRIQVRRELASEISRLWPERPARYSRALLETLALIAYRQPITRAEIEAVRGVAVNPNILKTVIERNWVRVVGHRDVPGRPELLGTTREFLDYFGLKSLDELPPLAELKALGDIKVQFELPDAGPIGAPGAPGAEVSAGADAGSGAAELDGGANVGGTLQPLRAGVGDAESAANSVMLAGDVAPAGAGDDGDTASATGAAAGADGAARGPAGMVETVENAAEGTAGANLEAEKFAASIEADLAAGDDDSADDDELSASGPGSSELVAGPRNLDD
jgi:segregation and condensation protein B